MVVGRPTIRTRPPLNSFAFSLSLSSSALMAEEGLSYWARWQVGVCALLIVLPAAAAIIVLARAKSDLRHASLWAPCWRGLHPLWLLAFRASVFLSMSWLLVQEVLIDSAFAFFFYTQWTFTLVIIYFAIATLISAHGCWISLKQHASENEETNEFLKRDGEETRTATVTSTENHNSDASKLRNYYERRDNARKAGHLGYIMQIIYQTSAGAVMLTDVVFWGLLVPFMSSEHFSLNWVMVCMHSLNAVFLLLDTFLNSLPFPWFRMAYFVLLSCIYVTFQWVLHACGFSWWPYPFLELETPWAPLWYFGVALVHIPCYGFYWLVAKAKDTFFSKLFSHAFIKPY